MREIFAMRLKRCSKCKKGLRSENRSGLCWFHLVRRHHKASNDLKRAIELPV